MYPRTTGGCRYPFQGQKYREVTALGPYPPLAAGGCLGDGFPLTQELAMTTLNVIKADTGGYVGRVGPGKRVP